jgi:IS30 family transposase
MSTQTLTTYYCAFCDAVASFFKGAVENTQLDSRFNRKTYTELSALSDYELRDIGISRGEIMHIAMGGAPFRGVR